MAEMELVRLKATLRVLRLHESGQRRNQRRSRVTLKSREQRMRDCEQAL